MSFINLERWRKIPFYARLQIVWIVFSCQIKSKFKNKK